MQNNKKAAQIVGAESENIVIIGQALKTIRRAISAEYDRIESLGYKDEFVEIVKMEGAFSDLMNAYTDHISALIVYKIVEQ